MTKPNSLTFQIPYLRGFEAEVIQAEAGVAELNEQIRQLHQLVAKNKEEHACTLQAIRANVTNSIAQLTIRIDTAMAEFAKYDFGPATNYRHNEGIRTLRYSVNKMLTELKQAVNLTKHDLT